MSGGKRLRPAVTMAACKAAGGRPGDAIAAAVALEMIHTYSLVHDDLPCMDNDDMRRGKPTVHRAFNEALAVLAGDALLTDAFSVVAEGLKTRPGVACEVMFEIAAAAGSCGMVGGQVLDTAAGGPKRGRLWLERMFAMKTGALFTASARAGGLCAGAGKSPSAMKLLEGFAGSFGLAFQIADDILDARAGKDEPCNIALIEGEEAAIARVCALVGDAVDRARWFGKNGTDLVDLTKIISASLIS
jgi:geranylgeranyl pyrophosphate synthase